MNDTTPAVALLRAEHERQLAAVMPATITQA